MPDYTWVQTVIKDYGVLNKKYDADLDGLIDADKVADLPRSKITDFFNSPFWGSIPDKPSAYPPEAHASSHEEGGADALNPENIGANWNKLVNKPSVFPPEAHASSHKDGGSDEVIGIAKMGTTLPAAGIAGRFFIKTDTLELYYDDGTSWVKIGKLAGLDLDSHGSRHNSGGDDAITSLDASVITSGILDAARIPAIAPSKLDAIDTPSDGEVPVYNASQTKFEWKAMSALRAATIIVAAYNSRDKSKADYVCDGADDQDTINQAISDLPSAGGKVLLLEGRYNISSYIRIDKSNVTLSGMGRGTEIYVEDGSNCDGIRVIGYPNKPIGVVIENMLLNGNKANQTGGHGIRFLGTYLAYPVQYSVVRNCYIKDWYENGIYLYFAKKCEVVGCYVSGCGSSGIFVEYYSEDNFINRNKCESCAWGIATSGTCKRIVIGKNLCLNNSNNGISLITSEDCIVAENMCKGNGTDGIDLYGSSYNTLIANRCRDNGSYGIDISDSGSNDNLVVKNYLKNNSAGSLRDLGTGTIKAASTSNDNVT